MSAYLYLMSFLPGLDAPDGMRPINPSDFWSRVAEIGGAAVDAVRFVFLRRDVEILEAMALEQDAARREALAEKGFFFTREQFSGVEPLPAWVFRPSDASSSSLVALWRSYFAFGLVQARRAESRLLGEYIAWETALRNSLAVERAARMGASAPEQWLIDLEETNEKYTRQDFSEIIARWRQENSPLESEKLLDRARWDFVDQNTPYFSFATDEVVGYALKLGMVDRWNSLIQERGEKILEEIAG